MNERRLSPPKEVPPSRLILLAIVVKVLGLLMAFYAGYEIISVATIPGQYWISTGAQRAAWFGLIAGLLAFFFA